METQSDVGDEAGGQAWVARALSWRNGNVTTYVLSPSGQELGTAICGTEPVEDVTGLPRLYFKQYPARGWEFVQSPEWVPRQVVAVSTQASHAARKKYTRACLGQGRARCCFSSSQSGRPAQPHQKKKQCVFCDPVQMAAACETVKGRGSVTRALKKFRESYQDCSYIYNAAILRVPEEWREALHVAALKQKRGPPKQKRNPSVESQVAKIAEDWTAALEGRERAFKGLSSKEVTAYKKRRTADRSRVEKKFFLDNDLPKPEPMDVAENDAGLPAAATSERARFVELFCKFGSWAICKECRSLQPRPLEPMDTRRIAAAEMTAKACKQCRSKQWVPQPEDIPGPLRKLSVKLSKALRPLDIDVGPVKKATNGYRIHSSMTRLSWSKDAVEDKIRKAPKWEGFAGGAGNGACGP